MSETLFRGKRTDNSEWAYGIPTRFRGLDNKVHTDIIPEINGEHFMSEGVEVVPDTVGQYIGLPDHAGTKIFEGDVVSFSAEEYFKSDGRLVAVDRHGEIVFCEGAFMILSENSYFALSKSAVKAYGLVVCGNIHDTPELLP